MDLNDFGTQASNPSRTNNDQRYYQPPGYFAGEGGNRDRKSVV